MQLATEVMNVLKLLLNHISATFFFLHKVAQADLTTCLSTEVLSLCKLYSWCFKATGGRLSLKSLRENSVMRCCKLERISAAPSAEQTSHCIFISQLGWDSPICVWRSFNSGVVTNWVPPPPPEIGFLLGPQTIPLVQIAFIRYSL